MGRWSGRQPATTSTELHGLPGQDAGVSVSLSGRPRATKVISTGDAPRRLA